MPKIYNRNLTAGQTDTGGRDAKPVNGGIDVFKARGHRTSFKITTAAINQVSAHYNANTLQDILEALKQEHLKGAGNMLSELEVEGAYQREYVEGSEPFEKSKEGVSGIKDHRTKERDNKAITGAAREEAQQTSKKAN